MIKLKKLTLTCEGRVVTAADFTGSADIEIINPDHHIATLESDGKLVLEATVERGRGYVTAEENQEHFEKIIGLIPVDSSSAPLPGLILEWKIPGLARLQTMTV